MIDVGACSTRPDSEPVSEQEEMQRLRFALPIIRKQAPDAVVSVDTFRPNVARMVVEEYGVEIINDVGAPVNSKQLSANNQETMFRMVSRLRVPYIYMSRKSTMKEVMLDCAEAVDTLRSMGQKDIILDPGFGFGKTVAENYQIMGELERMQALRLPVLVGISRKSMIWKQLCCTPDEALNGTTVLNTISLQKGASILRVHDVREAMECVKLVAQLNKLK
jgi:dihydropteroate synthase